MLGLQPYKIYLSLKQVKENGDLGEKPMSKKFHFLFFGGVLVMIAAVIVINIYLYEIRPGNSQRNVQMDV